MKGKNGDSIHNLEIDKIYWTCLALNNKLNHFRGLCTGGGDPNGTFVKHAPIIGPDLTEDRGRLVILVDRRRGDFHHDDLMRSLIPSEGGEVDRPGSLSTHEYVEVGKPLFEPLLFFSKRAYIPLWFGCLLADEGRIVVVVHIIVAFVIVNSNGEFKSPDPIKVAINGG